LSGVDPLFAPSGVFDVLSSFGEQSIVASKLPEAFRRDMIVVQRSLPSDTQIDNEEPDLI